ncbi:Zn-dependent exopeptidase [Basidiobolus meristosporus CBS 931.73]|uniref:Peptide hydrolase n=1 Tax=Basidiobolus meristosporus CBS 931.73 TaxID=1314790 RepID=A0A1Y1WVC0_9FUNG|nr:Zn-dependent exopeptidase [Basidiobolus meristosporus CBS 931.73]|eukprot:ORX77064.1 Zn-dependent exopeptidase [Basidiobolus meristosporus CBS 931.73]
MFLLVLILLVADTFNGVLRYGDNQRLIRTTFNSSGEWLSDFEVNQLIQSKMRFMDITDGEMIRIPSRPKSEIPTTLSGQSEARRYIMDVELALMSFALRRITRFKNRYHNSEFGLAASEWLYQQLEYIISNNPGANVSLKYFSHAWMQKSIIVRFEGSVKENTESVIVSSSLDSLNKWLPDTGVAPGADDSGSGAVSLLEAFRCLFEGVYKPARPVEFHWYSGHSAGLIGSQDIARSYVARGQEIVGLLHTDMTGFSRHSNQIGVATDMSDSTLARFVISIVSEYSNLVAMEMKCGFACSDHVPWHLSGYRSIFQHESTMLDSNPFTRTGSDGIQNIDFYRMREFTKVLIGFVIELSR